MGRAAPSLCLLQGNRMGRGGGTTLSPDLTQPLRKQQQQTGEFAGGQACTSKKEGEVAGDFHLL